MPHEPTGIELSRDYYRDVVGPLLTSTFPGLPHTAGRFGTGSDVLGLDDATSRDHDWGLRLTLFVPAESVEAVDARLERALPDSFSGLPTRFAFTGQTEQRHHVDVGTLEDFLHDRLGFDPRAGMTPADWLSLTGQAVLEVTAGPVFADVTGELATVRRLLQWYPDDVSRLVLACDWSRLEQELPLMSRAAAAGDDLGSRVILSRLVSIAMHLAFLLEQRWPPYAKWFGTLFSGLSCANGVGDTLDSAMLATDWRQRQGELSRALQRLLVVQNDLGLTDVHEATIPFWDRPFVHPDPRIVEQLLDGIADPAICELPVGLGSVEQRTDNVALLTDATARRALIGA
ncbi:DUF4037 domain-containing protein [Humibacter soli]